jgi:hypothetical protein
MIVFYVLMLSASIIFGSRAKNKVLGQLYSRCPGCGREGYQRQVDNNQADAWFLAQQNQPQVPQIR